MARRFPGCVFVAPHQDDEWIGLAQTLQKTRGTKILIMVTKSLWPSNERYGVRQLETARAMASLGVEVQDLGLTEEELFDPPYDPANYIGATMESEWSTKIKVFFDEYVSRFDVTHFFYPSSDDASGHVVHGFTRNIVTSALSTVVGNFTKNVYNVYAEPSTARPHRCGFRWKYNGLQKYYPTQWDMIKDDPATVAHIVTHSNFEYLEVES